MKPILIILLCATVLLGGCQSIDGKYMTRNETEDRLSQIEKRINDITEQKENNIEDNKNQGDNLLGKTDGGKYYCIDEAIKIPNQYDYLLKGYYISLTGGKVYQTLTAPDSWLEERVGQYGCLVASLREGYCSEITYTTGSIGGGYGTIQSELSDKALNDNATRNGYYYFCEDLTEVQKYKQEYRKKNFNHK